MKSYLPKYLLLTAFVLVLVAIFGSLYFSEIAHFVPCTLCWYQRICMYPLVVILGIGIIEKKEDIFKYVLPFSVIGWIVSIYHNLIQYRVISENLNVCTAIGSCSQRYINLYGFVTIPLLSLIAFTLINICVITYIIAKKK
jgi:disulfide bond formation protein DsbB